MKWIFKNYKIASPYIVFECEADTIVTADGLFKAATGIDPDKNSSIARYCPELPCNFIHEIFDLTSQRNSLVEQLKSALDEIEQRIAADKQQKVDAYRRANDALIYKEQFFNTIGVRMINPWNKRSN